MIADETMHSIIYSPEECVTNLLRLHYMIETAGGMRGAFRAGKIGLVIYGEIRYNECRKKDAKGVFPMIQVIHGKKGSGKTKRILDMANAAIKEHKGDVIFVDDDNRYMFDLRHEVRFVNAGEYGTDCPEMFFGFLCGMLAQNFDISVIFIDAFMKLVKTTVDNTADFFARLEKLSEKHNVNFILSVSCDDEAAPDHIRKYFI